MLFIFVVESTPEKNRFFMTESELDAQRKSDVLNADYVSHKVQYAPDGNREATPLTSENHAFYVGKMFPEKRFGVLREAITGTPANRSFYSSDFIRGALSTLLHRLPEGEKARVVVGRSLSEIFNGEEDVEGALSFEEQREKILEIAKKVDLTADRVDVVEMEELHPELFKALRWSTERHGKVDVHQALKPAMRNPLRMHSSSLDIAHHLYEAAQEDDDLYRAFKFSVPRQLREEESEASTYYALAEVAIRLRDMLDGRFIHGGAERQAKYDFIIQRILRGKFSQNLPELTRLFEDQRFETIHLDLDYFQNKRVATVALARRAVLATVAALSVWGLVETGRYLERVDARERQAKADDYVARSLVGMDFSWRMHWGRSTPEGRKNAFIASTKIMLDYMRERYPQIDEDFYVFLGPLVKSYLIENKRNLRTAYTNYTYDGGMDIFFEMIDDFVRKNRILLLDNGYDIEMPYAFLLDHREDLDQLLNGDHKDHYHEGSSSVKCVGKITPPGSAVSTYELCLSKPMSLDGGAYAMTAHLGFDYRFVARDTVFDDPQYFRTPFVFSQFVDDFRVMVADQIRRQSGDFRQPYTSENARIAVRSAMDSMRKAALLPLTYLDELYVDRPVRSAASPDTVGHAPVDISIKKPAGVEVIKVKDPFGEWEYEVTADYVSKTGKKFENEFERMDDIAWVLFAKTPEDALFTTARGREVAELFQDLRYPWTKEDK